MLRRVMLNWARTEPAIGRVNAATSEATVPTDNLFSFSSFKMIDSLGVRLAMR